MFETILGWLWEIPNGKVKEHNKNTLGKVLGKYTVEAYDKKLHLSVPESGQFLLFISKSRILDISSWLYIYTVFHAESESAVRIEQFLHPEEKIKKNRPMRVSISYRKISYYMSPPYAFSDSCQFLLDFEALNPVDTVSR